MQSCNEFSNEISHVESVENNFLMVTWAMREDEDDSRRGTMYCFKSCQANQN